MKKGNENVKFGVSSPVEGEVKELREDVRELFLQVRAMLGFVREALGETDIKHIEKAREVGRKIHAQEGELTPLLVRRGVEVEDLKPLISVPSHLERIGDNLESITYALQTKMDNEISFSEKVVRGLVLLFNKVDELLEAASDCLITRNRLLLLHVKVEGEHIGRLTNDYVRRHENRLTEEGSLARSSSIYFDILDSLKSIGWHLKEIADRLS
jgi:Na+/phosphate symporter